MMVEPKPCPFTRLLNKRKKVGGLSLEHHSDAESDEQARLPIPSPQEWFQQGRRVLYDPARKRIVSHETPTSVYVWERVVAPFRATSSRSGVRWLTLTGGFPDGTYAYAKLDNLLQTSPRLYVEYAGVGDSDKPSNYAHSVADRANLIEAQWKAHGIRRTVLVTLSCSSMVMMELLARQRERLSLGLPLKTRIEHVLTINGGYFADGHTPHPLNSNPFVANTIGRAAMKAGQHFNMVLDPIFKKCFSKEYNLTKQELRAFEEVVRNRKGMNLFSSSAMNYVQEHKKHAGRWDLVNIYKQTRRMGVTFTLVGAEQDQFEAKSFALAKERLGGAEDVYFEVLPGAHHTATEHPHRVAQLIDAVAMAPAFEDFLGHHDSFPSKRSSQAGSDASTVSTATSSHVDSSSSTSLFDAEYPEDFEFPF